MNKINPHQMGRPSVREHRINAQFGPLIKLVEKKQYPEIVQKAASLLKVLPGHPYLLKAMSFGLIGVENYDGAAEILDQAILKSARDPELHNNLGICLSATLRWDRAIESFDRALSLDPNDPEIWKNRGAALSHMSRWPEAIANLTKAVELHPGDYDEAIDQLALALLNSGRSPEALACYTELLKVDPENPFYWGCYIYAGLKCSHWQDLDANVEKLRRYTDGFRHRPPGPFLAMAMPGITAEELRVVAETTARSCVLPSVLNAPYEVTGNRKGSRREGKLRIGYLSYDFKIHPVGFLLPEIMELHDRNQFEIFGFSTGPNDGSAIRQRLTAAFDHFVDISALGSESGAKRIRDEDIDILVDLQGWTTGERASMLALRPAPIQVNWLGFAGSIGLRRFADYILGDAIVTPLEHAAYYAEEIVQLPNFYMPIDSTQGLLPAPSRSAAGLPEEGFVFCSLNNPYKVNPQVFDVWCELLREAPGSCLWLLRPAGDGAEVLLREAEMRGVARERIVFAKFVQSRSEYLARLQLADLALDPTPYNSHSSGLDVLWAGVPMVTLLGETFAGRVGASLVTAAGLPECVTKSWDEYLALCLDLFRTPEKLSSMRRRLIAGRTTAPLFDMSRFTRDLETVFARIYEKGAGGGPVNV